MTQQKTTSVDFVSLAAKVLQTVIRMQNDGESDTATINAIIDLINPDFPFRAASTSELAQALGESPAEAAKTEREVHAIIRRQDMKDSVI